MGDINVVSMALYRIEELKESYRKNGKLPILNGDQLALLELNKEHDKAVELLEKFQEENEKLKEMLHQLGENTAKEVTGLMTENGRLKEDKDKMKDLLFKAQEVMGKIRTKVPQSYSKIFDDIHELFYEWNDEKGDFVKINEKP